MFRHLSRSLSDRLPLLSFRRRSHIRHLRNCLPRLSSKFPVFLRGTGRPSRLSNRGFSHCTRSFLTSALRLMTRAPPNHCLEVSDLVVTAKTFRDRSDGTDSPDSSHEYRSTRIYEEPLQYLGFYPLVKEVFPVLVLYWVLVPLFCRKFIFFCPCVGGFTVFRFCCRGP